MQKFRTEHTTARWRSIFSPLNTLNSTFGKAYLNTWDAGDQVLQRYAAICHRLQFTEFSRETTWKTVQNRAVHVNPFNTAGHFSRIGAYSPSLGKLGFKGLNQSPYCPMLENQSLPCSWNYCLKFSQNSGWDSEENLHLHELNINWNLGKKFKKLFCSWKQNPKENTLPRTVKKCENANRGRFY